MHKLAGENSRGRVSGEYRGTHQREGDQRVHDATETGAVKWKRAYRDRVQYCVYWQVSENRFGYSRNTLALRGGKCLLKLSRLDWP